ncbi:MAG TPA: radical SAM/SPASM domain-containing protein [Verrucomicrobia bacterium]|nr:radical SAM/SPASM domain-containing protein [Verrucomicrobiota bacterium]
MNPAPAEAVRNTRSAAENKSGRPDAPAFILAWEVTRRCSLRCRHCRGAARDLAYAGEFSTEECFRTIDALAEFARPMIILTGGEPLMRSDIHEIARYAVDHGCRVVLATCGHLLTADLARELKRAGVAAISVSLDAAMPSVHDDFRGVPGAFEKTVQALGHLRAEGIPFQVNVTVSLLNVHELAEIQSLAIGFGASTVDYFFLVPSGRGAGMADLALPPEARDRALAWIALQVGKAPVRVKTTCAPQYHRFVDDPHFRGCMGGRGFVFLSHPGILQPCGFLDVPCGDVRAADFDVARLYRESAVFKDLRMLDALAGCPARAYARSGCYMAGEEC